MKGQGHGGKTPKMELHVLKATSGPIDGQHLDQ